MKREPGNLTLLDSQTHSPKGWVRERLGEICKTTSGGTPSRKHTEYYGGGIPWLKSGELENGTIRSTEESITEEGLKNSSTKIIPKETLLIALYGATVGKLGILGIDAAINQAICAIFTPDELNKKFLFWFLYDYRKTLLSVRKGGAQPNISQQIVNDIGIPFPPPAEQHRIVAKIEELFTRLDVGIESLQKVKTQTKRYRQSVLKHAFEGKLTEEWREAHKGEIEPASVFLDRVIEKHPKKLQGKLKELKSIDKSDRSKLPDGWIWIRLGSLCETASGGTPNRANTNYFGGNIPWLKSGELENGTIRSTEESITEEGLKNSSTKIIPKGTLLIALYGATVGKLGILGIDAAINQAICAIFTPDELNKKFLFGFCMIIEKVY